jgi:hypothetical protein
MRAATINNLSGSYGTIEHALIWTLVSEYSLDRLYIDGREITADHVAAVHRHGLEVGARWARNWFEGESVIDIAREMDATLTRIGVNAKQCAVNWDFEDHDNAGLMQWLREWRALRPRRNTSWSLEPMQRGWFSSTLIEMLRADLHLEVWAQTYHGGMYPVAQDACWRNLASALRPEQCKLEYDGAHGAPASMDGNVFTLERLPL